MISDNQLTAIGRAIKTHGTVGEINIELYNPDVYLPQAGDCLIFDIDGIYVPFFVKTVRQRGDTRVLILLDDIESDIEASAFTGQEVYALTENIAENGRNDDDEYLTLDDLVGYIIYDADGTEVGLIKAVDDSTENVLFEVTRPDGSTVYVPAVNELVTELDNDNSKLVMDLPTGLY